MMKWPLQPSIVLLVLLPRCSSNFIGPFGPRTGTGTGTVAEPPPSATGGLSKEEVRAMMKHRHALVIAGDDELTALAIAEGLVDVGASVILGCGKPERAQKAAERRGIARKEEAGSDWSPGCEVRALELGSPAGVYAFAETMLDDDRPLHVIVNCADDVSPFYQRESSVVSGGGWETTAGRNHLGPFLLTQLMLDKVVATMKSDAKTSRSAARLAERRSSARLTTRTSDRSSTATQDFIEENNANQQEVIARPYPAPLGRVVSLGLHARIGRQRSRKRAEDPPAVKGLFVGASNYSEWGTYRTAHEANTLSSLHLSKMLRAVPAPHTGEIVEVNVVRPAFGRWLPRPVRRMLRVSQAPALTATFLASTPMKGLNGLFFSDFAAEPAWQRAQPCQRGQRQAYAAKQLFAASMSATGSPAASWRSEGAMVVRGAMARERRRKAEVRQRSRRSRARGGAD